MAKTFGTKFWHFVLILCLFAGIIGYANEGKRFTKIITQDNSSEDSVKLFEVWHDNTSGQEFVCAFQSKGDWSVQPLSCFPSGRNWK